MLLIADNLQIINKTVEKALNSMESEPIKQIVIKCEKAGAQAIDINPGSLKKGAEKMAFLVKTVQKVSDLPVLLDTANFYAMEAGLQANKKKAIINGFSIVPEKLNSMLYLAKQYDVDIIGYLLDKNGHVPSTANERLNVAVEIYNEFVKSGIKKERLIIDPVIVPITWQNGNQHAQDVLFVLKMLPELLGFPVKTVAGLSNLTSGAKCRAKKLLLEKVYIPMLAISGLDMVLLNIFHHETVKAANVCNTILNSKIFAWEEISE